MEWTAKYAGEGARDIHYVDFVDSEGKTIGTFYARKSKEETMAMGEAIASSAARIAELETINDGIRSNGGKQIGMCHSCKTTIWANQGMVSDHAGLNWHPMCKVGDRAREAETDRDELARKCGVLADELKFKRGCMESGTLQWRESGNQYGLVTDDKQFNADFEKATNAERIEGVE